MCLAVPAKVTKLLPNEMSEVQIGPLKQTVFTGLIENVQEGDYLIIHVGHAISRLDPDEALKTLELFSEIDEKFQTNYTTNEVR